MYRRSRGGPDLASTPRWGPNRPEPAVTKTFRTTNTSKAVNPMQIMAMKYWSLPRGRDGMTAAAHVIQTTTSIRPSPPLSLASTASPPRMPTTSQIPRKSRTRRPPRQSFAVRSSPAAAVASTSASAGTSAMARRAWRPKSGFIARMNAARSPIRRPPQADPIAKIETQPRAPINTEGQRAARRLAGVTNRASLVSRYHLMAQRRPGRGRPWSRSEMLMRYLGSGGRS